MYNVFRDILATCCRKIKPFCENILSVGDDFVGAANIFYWVDGEIRMWVRVLYSSSTHTQLKFISTTKNMRDLT